MVLNSIDKETPFIPIKPEKAKQLESNTAFDESSDCRDANERSTDQSKGKIAEYIFAKYLDANYEKEWIWLDDESEVEEPTIDFLIETAIGTGSVDVKCRKLSTLQGFENEPDHLTRFKFKNGEFAKTHEHNHVHVMILLQDNIPEYDHTIGGSIVGVVGLEQMINAEEYTAKDGDKNGAYKDKIPSTEIHAHDEIEQVVINGLKYQSENVGMPSFADKMVESDHINLDVDATLTEKDFEPLRNTYTGENVDIEVLQFLDQIDIDFNHFGTLRGPAISEDICENQVKELQDIALENQVVVYPNAIESAIQNDIDVEKLIQSLNTFGINELSWNHVVKYWYGQQI